jgi:hypothetical protein
MDKEDLSRKAESVYLNEFFDFDPKANKTEDKVFGCKAILTNEEFWDAMQDGLYDTLNEGWSVILFQMGLRYGTSVGERARESLPDVQLAVKFLEYYGLMAGWGRFKTAPFTLVEGKLAAMSRLQWKTIFCKDRQEEKMGNSALLLCRRSSCGNNRGTAWRRSQLHRNKMHSHRSAGVRVPDNSKEHMKRTRVHCTIV